ncbi:MAG: 30S ribosomal protein S20 [Waddliaceae bacterium]
MAKETEEKKRKKRPTAEKRDLQNKKRRFENKIFKSRVRTAIRKFEDELNKSEELGTQESLNSVYKLLDKGVKKGIFKLNKASRTKSRLTTKASAKSKAIA